MKVDFERVTLELSELTNTIYIAVTDNNGNMIHQKDVTNRFANIAHMVNFTLKNESRNEKRN